MKVFAFALLLLVAVTYGKHRIQSSHSFLQIISFFFTTNLMSCVSGEALQCHNCVREAPDTPDCVETVETCLPEMDTCAKITYPAPYGEYHPSQTKDPNQRTKVLNILISVPQRTLSTNPVSR